MFIPAISIYTKYMRAKLLIEIFKCLFPINAINKIDVGKSIEMIQYKAFVSIKRVSNVSPAFITLWLCKLFIIIFYKTCPLLFYTIGKETDASYIYCHKALECGAPRNRNLLFGFSVQRIHQVCQSTMKRRV
jgi:hypothetical protein